MSYTTNQRSLLYQLRQLMPERPLTMLEARWVAEKQASRLLESCGIHDAGTPSEIVASFSNVRISHRSDLPTSGYTDWYRPNWLIFLNANEPAVRRRFSLFHEVKHIVDHPFVSYAYPATPGMSHERRAELVADYFAACVLMPRKFLRSVYFEGQHDVEELAGMFNVSVPAMTFRLQDLGLLERPSRVPPGQLSDRFRPLPNADGRARYRRAASSLVLESA